ncbi:TPA: DNA-binding protein [Vibrio alginolyticus]
MAAVVAYSLSSHYGAVSVDNPEERSPILLGWGEWFEERNIDFDREADSYGEAVQTAIQQVNQVSGLIVKESDHVTSQLKELEPSEYLTNQQTIQAYIDEAASTGEPEIIAEALATVAKAKGMDNTLHPRDNPSLSSLIGLTNVLGISVRLGINIK